MLVLQEASQLPNIWDCSSKVVCKEQRVEQGAARVPEGIGSIPISSTVILSSLTCELGGVSTKCENSSAVEHLVANEDVAGSIPVFRSELVLVETSLTASTTVLGVGCKLKV